MRAMSDVIAIRGLEKRYGSYTALSGLDLNVHPGEVYGFLGRNGAGKSTTIRILMGITRPSAGEVRLFGERFDRDLVRLRQRIGYVAQEQSFYGWMTPKHLAIVSNRAKPEAGALVRWHWEKAGTIEHVHRVMKDELGAGVMPSGRFGANAAWFRINALTFNVLTVLKRRALPERLRDARPKRLRFELFTLPGKLAIHQSRLSVHTSAREERLGEVVDARGRLLAILQARRAV